MAWNVGEKDTILNDIIEAKKVMDEYNKDAPKIYISKELYDALMNYKPKMDPYTLDKLAYYYSGNPPYHRVSRDKRPRAVCKVERHWSVMPRWYWRLLCDLQDIRDMLHFSWWLEQRRSETNGILQDSKPL